MVLTAPSTHCPSASPGEAPPSPGQPSLRLAVRRWLSRATHPPPGANPSSSRPLQQGRLRGPSRPAHQCYTANVAVRKGLPTQDTKCSTDVTSMAERIKAHFLPLPAGAVAPRTATAAQAAVDRAAASEADGLCTAVSTGAWLPLLSAGLCRKWSIEGLGFLLDDLRIVSPGESTSAASAIDQLLSKLEAGERPLDDKGLGVQWRLVISPADLATIISQTVPRPDLDEQDGEDSVFIAFLVAVQLAATDAAAAGANLLFWCAPE